MAANLSWVVLSVAVGSLVNLDPFTPKKTLPDPPLPLRRTRRVQTDTLKKLHLPTKAAFADLLNAI